MKESKNGIFKRIYIALVRPLIGSHLNQQRIKLILLYGWQYFKLFGYVSFPQALYLIYKFYIIDLFVLSGHSSKEMMAIAKYFFSRSSKGPEIFVEAGCWNGGSSAKFSLMCHFVNMKLHVFDSFEGVEQTDDELSFFGGDYAAPLERVERNISKYGKIEVVSFHKGWFKDTFKKLPFEEKIGVIYIDCDLKTGTSEVLNGVKNGLSPMALIFSQDYHIPPIKILLDDLEFWHGMNLSVGLKQLTKKLVLITPVKN